MQTGISRDRQKLYGPVLFIVLKANMHFYRKFETVQF